MKKVGILTVHSSINFGAVLQAYSLMTILKKKGFDAEFIDYQCQAVIERENNKKLGTKDYLKKISKDNIEKYNINIMDIHSTYIRYYCRCCCSRFCSKNAPTSNYIFKNG